MNLNKKYEMIKSLMLTVEYILKPPFMHFHREKTPAKLLSRPYLLAITLVWTTFVIYRFCLMQVISRAGMGLRLGAASGTRPRFYRSRSSADSSPRMER